MEIVLQLSIVIHNALVSPRYLEEMCPSNALLKKSFYNLCYQINGSISLGRHYKQWHDTETSNWEQDAEDC